MTAKVSALNYYPVKSLRGIEVDQIELDAFGFKNDRRYMLIDSNGRFVTQRQHPILSKVSAHIDSRGVILKGPGFETSCFERSEFGDSKNTTVWRDDVVASVLPSAQLSELSALLGFSVSLAYMPEESFRQVDRDFFAQDQRVSFADAFPILLTNQSSLEDLNGRLSEPVPMRRFRPNLVIEGAEAYAEDEWQQIRIGDILFDCVKPCSRCVMTTINDQAEKGKEPLATLATYRKNEFGVCFGENLVHRATGTICVGDEVEVIC